ncbi:hypothetical protein ACFSR7_01865 [Cohnella sp. GCM10020058]|uniref:hypothetical protein n=1 Tax=Cohnella sp. GCM10020058 TaxID=3317330 RepID=UPI003627C6BD
MAFLSMILDASTGELLAYNLSNCLTLSLATKTIDNLKKQRRLKLHKDAFITPIKVVAIPKAAEEDGLSQSISRRKNCWDDAPYESFYGHMKDHVISSNCFTLEEQSLEIDRYVRITTTTNTNWNEKGTPYYTNH